MEAVSDFRNYPGKRREELVGQLCRVISELANAHIIWGGSAQAEKSARVLGFSRSEATTVAARERDSEAQALSMTLAVLELQASIRALEEERDLLYFLLREPDAGADQRVDCDK